MELMIITPNILKRFYPLNTFQEEDLKTVNKQAHLNNLSRHEILFSEGSEDEDVIYLINGSIKLTSENGASFIMDADSEQALYPIANIKPRKFSAYVNSETAAIARIPVKAVENYMPGNDKGSYFGKNTITHQNDMRVLDSDWMMAMKRTPLFQKLQEEYISQLFQVMEEDRFTSGQHVVLQGEEGDYFYMIKEGQCEVSQFNGTKQVILAKLGPTESFGEEALLMRKPRSATVSMLTDGVLMRISKSDFEHFMYQPVIQWVNPVEAGKLLREGAVPVDIRKAREGQKSLPNALKIPVALLRSQLKTLEKEKSYLILCDDSHDSALASYLFGKFGLDGHILRNEPKAAAAIEDGAD